MPSPSWLTEPSIATSRAASAGRPAAKTPKGAARMARPSLQACRCWAEMGAARPRRRFSRVPRSLKPGAPERALVAVRDPLVPGRLDMGGGEGRAVPGEEQPGEDRVLGVVRAGRVVGHVARDAAPAGADLGGLHVLRGGPEGVPDGQAEQRAAGPLAEFGGVLGAGTEGMQAIDAIRGLSSRGLRAGRGALCGCVPPEAVRQSLGRLSITRSTSDAGSRSGERSRVKPQVSPAFPCWRRESDGVV